MNIKRIEEYLKKHNSGKTGYDIVEFYTFVDNAQQYIKATKQARMICSIDTVSKSGMSRKMKFLELKKNTRTSQHQLLNFNVFFRAMGYRPVRDSDYFRISGCGMDMVFHTNYEIIHRLHHLGFITKKTCETLAQRTPHII